MTHPTNTPAMADLSPLPKPKAPAAEYFSDEPVYSAVEVEEIRRAAVATSRRTAGDASAGFRLLPVVPTDAMCVAAREKTKMGSNIADHVYRAMVAAAPVSAGQAGKVAMTVADLMRVVRANWGDMAAIERAFAANFSAESAAAPADSEKAVWWDRAAGGFYLSWESVPEKHRAEKGRVVKMVAAEGASK